MVSITSRKLCAIFFCIFFLLQYPVFAQEARLTRITVSNTRDDLLLYFTLRGAFTEKLQEAILSGVPATFSFYITLDSVRSFWFDKEMVDIDELRCEKE